jgi:hypothetical protein
MKDATLLRRSPLPTASAMAALRAFMVAFEVQSDSGLLLGTRLGDRRCGATGDPATARVD